jgi:seryl-tRNA synthetase
MPEETTTTTADAAGAAMPNGGQVEFTPEQQQHIDKLIGDRLARAQDKWQQEQERIKAKASEAAEQKRLEDEKNYQKLLEKATGKIAELEPLPAQLEQAQGVIEAYRQTIGDILANEIKVLGDAAKTAVDNLPGQPDELGKLKWLNANKALFSQQQQPAQPAPARGGTPPRHPAQVRPAVTDNNNTAQPAPINIRF